MRGALAQAEARLESMTADNRRLNREVRESIVALGGLQHKLGQARNASAAVASGQAEEADRKRITELQTQLVEVRATADRADELARSQADEARRVIEALKKRLEESAIETAHLRARIAAFEEAQAAARTLAAAEKKRAESR